MQTYVVIIDLIGLSLMVLGIHLAFRQEQVRAWLARLRGCQRVQPRPPAEDDPAHYVMRIAGMMMAAFGVVICLMFTMVATAT